VIARRHAFRGRFGFGKRGKRECAPARALSCLDVARPGGLSSDDLRQIAGFQKGGVIRREVPTPIGVLYR
jgi:hypothetical protein